MDDEADRLVDDLRVFFGGREEPGRTEPLPRPQGWFKWIVKPTATCDTGCLNINGTLYLFTWLRADRPRKTLPWPPPCGIRLTKADGTSWDIDTTGVTWFCDCPDSEFRRRPVGQVCKHVLACQKAVEYL